MPTTGCMARRIKPATVASVSDAARRPVDGYSEAELTKAFEVLRHQAMVLKARSRVAAAALGVTPEELEPEPPRLRVVGSDGRHVELDVEAAALRDAQAALDQRAADLDAARRELASQRSVVERQAHDAEATRRRYEQLHEELAARDAATAVRERELADLAAQIDADAAALDQRAADLDEARHELATQRSAVERQAHDAEAKLDEERRELGARRGDLEKRVASVDAERQRVELLSVEVAHARSTLDEAESELARRMAGVERERAELDAQHRELVELQKDVTKRVEEQLASVERDRQALKDAEHDAHERALVRERELATAEAAVVQREAAVEREMGHLDELRKQLADDRASAEALLAPREDRLRAVEREYQAKVQQLESAQARRQEEIAAAEAALVERAEEVDTARLELADERTELAELRRDLNERAAALETREREHEDALEQLRDAEADLGKAEEAATARRAKLDDELAKRAAEITERAAAAEARVRELRGLEASHREGLDRLRGEEESLARRAEVVEAAERALEAARADHEEQRRKESEERQRHLDELARARTELESRETEVERTRHELAAEHQRLEDEKRLVAELRVSLDYDARANQALKEELDQHAAEVASQARALAERAASATARRPDGPQREEVVSPHEEGQTRSRFTVDELATLMERRSDEFRDRIEEWQYYLLSLRSVATSDGRLPESVEYLVEDVFAPLLDTA